LWGTLPHANASGATSQRGCVFVRSREDLFKLGASVRQSAPLPAPTFFWARREF